LRESNREVRVTVAMGVSAIPPEPLRVETRSVPLNPALADVEARCRERQARCISREEIVSAGGTVTLPALLARIAGARVTDTGYGDTVIQIRARARFKKRPAFSDPAVEAFVKQNECPVALYVNGALWVRERILSGDDIVRDELTIKEAMARNKEFMGLRAGDIEAIEVFSGVATAPAIFSEAECDVVAVWLER
jgi:hypothetical protein